MAAGADPAIELARIGIQAEVELHRQLEVMEAIGVAQQQVQFAEGVTLAADRNVRGEQLDTGGMRECVLPEALVIEAEPSRAAAGEPGFERLGSIVMADEPVDQALGPVVPAAASQRMALAARRFAKQGRRQQCPGEVAHRSALQPREGLVEVGKGHG